MANDLAFPPGFLWGTASSAYQNEGNNVNSQWWRFEQQPDAIAHGQRSGDACDWWRHAEADFDRMQAAGLNAHRLSIEWSRVEPSPGRFDAAALARYRDLLLALRDRGIEPWAALHHFSNPLWLEDNGGWDNPTVVERFTAYAAEVAARLGDLCTTWLTFNEPLVYLGQGWYRGAWPPHRRSAIHGWRAFRHLLAAHAGTYHVLHRAIPTAQVSVAKAMRHFTPARPGHPGDALAAALRRHLYERLWLVATRQGRLLPPLGWGIPTPRLTDTMDFVGVNYYARYFVRATPDPRQLFGTEGYDPTREPSDSGSHGPYSRLDPDGLFIILRHARRWGKPIYVTENGLPDAHDVRRPRWILAHLLAIHQAIATGCDVRGYFHWTFVDNFEWSEGWSLRFGLVALDPATQVRTPRPSLDVYSQIARANALPGALLDRHGPGSRGE